LGEVKRFLSYGFPPRVAAYTGAGQAEDGRRAVRVALREVGIANSPSLGFRVESALRMDPAPPEFLDVRRLIDASVPKARPAFSWYAMVALLVVAVTATVTANAAPQAQALLKFLTGLIMLGVVVGLGTVTSHTVKLARAEQQKVEAIEELVQLRRWDQAGAMLESLLGAPTRSQGARLQALIYLSSVLARYHRFGDAVTVQEYLLDHAHFDPGTGQGIALMRAMAMLHEDRLVDADRAIGEIRRDAPDSAGLALVEIYRDVKTGHAAEAIAIFDERRAAMRAQLGHRIGDAHALVARAHDLLGNEAEAAAAFERGTLLVDPAELYRRYPEVAAIRDKYPAAPWPKEAA
jgi:hypothetical protein